MPAAYSRPGIALGVAAAGFIGTAALLLLFSGIRIAWAGVPASVDAIIGTLLSSLPLVAAVLVAAVVAARGGVGRATGIRRWRWTDPLLGVAVGLAVRGVVEVVHPTSGSLAGPIGGLDVAAVVVFAATAIVVSPVVEELFFRGLVLRALADALAGAGTALAAIVSILVSTVAFIALHLVTFGADVPVSIVIGTGLVGLGCGILTLATGRLGAALVAHAVYNTIGVVLLF